MKKLVVFVFMFIIMLPVFARGNIEMGQCYTTSTGYWYPKAKIDIDCTKVQITVDTGSFTVNGYDVLYQDLNGLSKTFSVEDYTDAQKLLRSAVFTLNSSNDKQNVVVTASNENEGDTDLTALPDYANFTITQHNIDGQPHYYAFVQLASTNGYNLTNSVSFDEAYAMAKKLKYLGMDGYLATITSEEENTLLDNITTFKGWGGGGRVSQEDAGLNGETFYSSDSIIGPKLNSNAWYWVCGPEAGKQFNSPNATVSEDSDTAFKYSYWATNEPNGVISSSDGEYLLMLHHENGNKWNDITNSGHKLPGFFVEWSGQDSFKYIMETFSNEKHDHSWVFSSQDGNIKAYCTTSEGSICPYYGSDNEMSLKPGTNQIFLDKTVYPSDVSNSNTVWSSSNPAIAKVNPDTGIITALSEGETTITATSTDGSGKSASATLTTVK